MNINTEKEFIRAYTEYSDALFRYCYFKIGDREIALDMVSDVFTKAWDYIRSGKEVENIRALLYRIAHNLVIDWYRKKKSLSLDALSEDGFDPVDTFANTSIQAELSHALEKMKELEQRDQDLITWRLVEEMSISEIAELISENENTVSVRLHRAMAKLKKVLQGS